ncbi:prepilin peptidase [Amycolatopsis sp. NPDC051716]|uniref:prepilin peptidase n=1 Tax=Amycolatopsis sp. NPDC051716 TaxID=3155804 RepID=UPI0034340B67
MNAWLTAGSAAVGLVLGAAASSITKTLLRQPARVAQSRWLGAVITAALLALLGWRIGFRGELAVYVYVVVLGVPLGVIDWVEHRLPRIVLLPQLAGATLGLGLLCFLRSDPAAGLRALWAALAAAGFYLLLAVLVEGGVGSGDVSLTAVVGLVTGWSSWLQFAGSLMLASLGALLLLLLPHHGSRRRAVPFGPCLLAAMTAVLAISG